jgi:hypothetical protein
MLIAYFLSRLPRAATASALACLLAYDGLFYFPGPTRTRFDRAAATIAAESTKPPDLFVDDMLVAPALGFYWKGPQPTFHSLLDFNKAESAASAGAEVWFVYTDRDRFERRATRLRHENIPIATEEFCAGYRLWTIHLFPRADRE